MPSALAFGFELASMGTPLEGAKLGVRQVPVRARCRACGQEVEPETWPLACPTCASFELAISGGEELRVEAIEIEDGTTAEPAHGEVVPPPAGEEEPRLLSVGA